MITVTHNGRDLDLDYTPGTRYPGGNPGDDIEETLDAYDTVTGEPVDLDYFEVSNLIDEYFNDEL